MVTVNQLIKKKRIKKFHKNPLNALDKSPQKRGVCVRVYITKPKKPNSALRKIAKVRLSNKRMVLCSIPGQGHNLAEYSVVLVRGGRVKDVPGVRFKLIKGGVKYDFGWSERFVRYNGRSKYGIPKNQHEFISNAVSAKKKEKN